MAHVDQHPTGSFCWLELATTDQNGAKKFYGSLFGWNLAEFPMGPEGTYTIFLSDGRNTGACYTMQPEMRAQGVPPNWLLYVAVENADETAAKAAPAGGKLVVPVLDVMDFGRMAVLQDPTGASFAIWQAKTHPGTGIEGVPGTMCWADLMTTDPAKASAFYGGVFGWKADPGKDSSGYLHILNRERPIGGIPPAGALPPDTPSHWLLYFLVEDCDRSTEKAKTLGANVYVPPKTMEGVGRWSVVADPQGAVLALFQPLPHQTAS
jgi:predicted enzyme related to lactoylglutathione lyase